MDSSLAGYASLACWEEFRPHPEAGLEQAGFTQKALKDLVVQTAGAPVANAAFTKAHEVIVDMEAKQTSLSRPSWLTD